MMKFPVKTELVVRKTAELVLLLAEIIIQRVVTPQTIIEDRIANKRVELSKLLEDYYPEYKEGGNEP
jgi:hypothetical protein